MKLRHKFGVLALIYVLSLSANLVMSGWCILEYFDSAFVDVQSTFVKQADVERLRLQVRGEIERRSIVGPRGREDESDARMVELTRAMRELKKKFAAGEVLPIAIWSELDEAAAAALDGTPPEALARVDHLLSRISSSITIRRRSAIVRAAATQQKVVAILIGNAALGGLLCMVGLVLVRRWVLLPVSGLRLATQQIAQGNFEYRVRPQSGDELGQLAEEVNQMSRTIADMQARLVDQERLAAAGEMVTRVAHNIRNPLAGIRGLAEATSQEGGRDGNVGDYQQRIIGAVDRLEKWLRDLQQSVAPMSLNLQQVEILDIIDSVCAVLRPVADRRGVRVDVDVDPAVRVVRVDGFHLEQALVALMTNAIQASSRGQTVRVVVAPRVEGHDRWCLSVVDEGEGVPEALREKIFLPYFTTKPDGNGVGLAMAVKVVKTHGGELTLASGSGTGSRFDAILPGHVPAES